MVVVGDRTDLSDEIRVGISPPTPIVYPVWYSSEALIGRNRICKIIYSVVLVVFLNYRESGLGVDKDQLVIIGLFLLTSTAISPSASPPIVIHFPEPILLTAFFYIKDRPMQNLQLPLSVKLLKLNPYFMLKNKPV